MLLSGTRMPLLLCTLLLGKILQRLLNFILAVLPTMTPWRLSLDSNKLPLLLLTKANLSLFPIESKTFQMLIKSIASLVALRMISDCLCMLNLINLNATFGLTRIQEEYIVSSKKTFKPWGEKNYYSSTFTS